MHCGCSGVRCLCSFLDRHVLSDTDALRNPQRQLASDRYAQKNDMRDFESLIEIREDSLLLQELKKFKNKIGMVEFIEKVDILPLSDKYVKIGNFELDILAIRKSNNEIVMLDHDSPEFEMGNCAKDIRSFLKALVGFINYMKACEQNNKLYNDTEQMNIVAGDSSKAAGSISYSWFYKMMFGI